MGLVSPTGHNDPDSAWVNPHQCYDDGPAIGYCLTAGHYLELTHSALNCDKVQIKWTYSYRTIQVDVYYSAAWHNIFDGAIASLDTWIEYEIGSTQSVTVMRFKASDGGLDCVEADFNEVPGGETHEATGTIDGQSTVSGTTKVTRKVSGSLAGQSAVSGLTKVIRKVVGSLAGQSGVSGLTKVIRKVSGSLAGQSAVSGLTKVIRKVSGSLAGQSTVSGIAQVTSRKIKTSIMPYLR